MAGPLYLGLDIGTQGTKGVVIDPASRGIVARASVSHGLIEGLAPGAAEQHPHTWWESVCEVVGHLHSQGTFDPKALAGIGVSGQQHGFVALDANDRVLRPAKLWCDTTCAGEAEELSRELGRTIPAGFTAPKILWMKRHEPELFARLHTVLLPHDYINFRLTGTKTMEAGDASGTGLFDVVERRFDAPSMATIEAGLSDRFPRLGEVGEPAGALQPSAAEELMLQSGIRVAPGGGDNMMSAIGSGATRRGIGVLSLGTSATIFAYSDRPIVDPDGAIAAFCDSTGAWLPLLCVMNATGVIEEVASAYRGQHDLNSLTRAARDVPLGCDGILLLPFLQGERVPNLPHARGVLLNISPGTLSPGHLFRAALEGTALNLAWGFERLRKLGLELEDLRVVGGGSKNELWLAILCDAIGVPVQRLAEPESAALGGALQARWVCERGAGACASIDEIANDFVSLAGAPIRPVAARQRAYGELLERFRVETQRNFASTV
jgi:xylulokinase